jgi:hypothetical protein
MKKKKKSVRIEMLMLLKVDAKFSILSSENGKPYVASVLRRMIKQGVDEIDAKLVNQYVHGI